MLDDADRNAQKVGREALAQFGVEGSSLPETQSPTTHPCTARVLVTAQRSLRIAATTTRYGVVT
jgi:hypothetical protein